MKQTFEVVNVKCGGCASTLKSKLKDQFGDVDVDLDVTPRKITLDIDDSQIEQLTKALRKLGYPLTTDEMGLLEGTTAKAKSFVSCAVGKMNES
ncbi:MAG: heavy-metal-associated domain-containing protein [Cocleimonas sp.]|nr:heavy-metal-associated domain-containing protein [Cocleimonas sp.]